MMNAVVDRVHDSAQPMSAVDPMTLHRGMYRARAT